MSCYILTPPPPTSSLHLQVDFCYLNSKANRRRLVRALFSVPRSSLQLLPYYARLTATLQRCMRDVGPALLQLLEEEFYALKTKKVGVPHTVCVSVTVWVRVGVRKLMSDNVCVCVGTHVCVYGLIHFTSHPLSGNPTRVIHPAAPALSFSPSALAYLLTGSNQHRISHPQCALLGRAGKVQSGSLQPHLQLPQGKGEREWAGECVTE